MRLRRLTLTNTRRFAGHRLIVDDFSDGLNVLSAPNEFGKSTIFDALQTLIFAKATAQTQEVKSLQPRPGGGAVEITVEIETADGRFRIDKRYLSRAMARVTNLGTGRIVGQDDTAEAWISGLMGQHGVGPAGLLWVRQGAGALDPDNQTERRGQEAARRGLLSSVAGEVDLVTGGRRMDRVMAVVNDLLGALVTEKNKAKAGGPLKAAQDACEATRAKLTILQGQVQNLRTALDERRRTQDRLAGLEEPAATARRTLGLAEAKAGMRRAEEHAATVTTARRDVALALAQHDTLVSGVGHLTDRKARLTKADQDLAKARSALAEAEVEVRATVVPATAANLALASCTARLTATRGAFGKAQTSALACAARSRADELAERVKRAEGAEGRLARANAALALNRATPAAMTGLADLGQNRQAALSAMAAQAMTLTMDYAGAARILVGQAPLPPGLTPLTVRTVLDIPGIGKMTVDPGPGPGPAARAALDKAEAALTAALSVLGAQSASEARIIADARRGFEADQQSAEQVLAALAPDGMAKLRADVAQAHAEAGGVEPREGEATPPSDLLMLEAALRLVETEERRAADKARQAEQIAAAARNRLSGAQVAVVMSGAALHDAQAALGDRATLAARESALAADLIAASATLTSARAKADLLAKTAPDLATAQAHLARAQSVVDGATKESTALRLALADLGATIRARAEEGVEEALAEAAGKLSGQELRVAALTGQAASLGHLRAALQAAQVAAREAYFGPVQAELAPLLAILHPDAALAFDPDRLLPGTLSRAGADEPIGQLSGGTQEQIAILTRLAFARLLARQGRPVPVILDDALVHSDDDRIVAMFTALHRVAIDQQIIVLSCRQMAFDALGGHRPTIRIEAVT